MLLTFLIIKWSNLLMIKLNQVNSSWSLLYPFLIQGFLRIKTHAADIFNFQITHDVAFRSLSQDIVYRADSSLSFWKLSNCVLCFDVCCVFWWLFCRLIWVFIWGLICVLVCPSCRPSKLKDVDFCSRRPISNKSVFFSYPSSIRLAL